MKALAWIALLSALASLALVSWVLIDRSALQERVVELERQSALAARRAPVAEEVAEAAAGMVVERMAASPASQASDDAQETERAVTLAVRDVEQLALRLDDLDTRLQDVTESSQQQGELLLAGQLPSGETVDQFLDRRIAEHLLGGARDRQGESAGGRTDHDPKKRPFAELSTALALDETQETIVRTLLDRGKDDAFQLLLAPRFDGGSFVNDLTQHFLQGGDDSEEAIGAIFMRAFKEPLPGTDETYGSALLALQVRTAGSIKGELREDQATTFESLDFDLFDIETGHDPFRDHITRRIEEAQTGR